MEAEDKGQPAGDVADPDQNMDEPSALGIRDSIVNQYARSDLSTDTGSAADIAINIVARKMATIKKKNSLARGGTDGGKVMGGADVDDVDISERDTLSRSSLGSTAEESIDDSITEEHRQYALTYGMMLGIRVSVGRLAMEDTRRHTLAKRCDVDDDEITDDDFGHVDKLVFPPAGNTRPPFITPPHKLTSSFKFKDYSPRVFRNIRRHFGIDESDYMLSLAGDFNFIEFIANSHSGQFFFYSHDGKYMIKTMEKAECRFLRSILPEYYHYVNSQPNTLMTRYYGMHRVKMRHIRKVMHFVIMGSVFATSLPIHVTYDLKGSTVGRSATQKERENGKVRKDLDLLQDQRVLLLGPDKETLVEQLRRDSEFLSSLEIMDYSLLVGIHDLSRGSAQSGRRHTSVVLTSDELQRLTNMLEGDAALLEESDLDTAKAKEGDAAGGGQGGFFGDPGEQNLWTRYKGGYRGRFEDGEESSEVWFMGIIDILQRYNARKRMENFIKGIKHDKHSISAVPPAEYARRFVEFIAENSS